MNTSRTEVEAKKIASDVLRELKDVYPTDTINTRFPLDTFWGAVVSLNFDAHWLSGEIPSWRSVLATNSTLAPVVGRGRSLKPELLRLNCHIELCSEDSITRRLWFPNGYLGHPRSLRLGLREFGFQPVAIHEAFESVKKYEKEAGSFPQRLEAVRSALEGSAMLTYFMVTEPKLPLTWVTEMLYRPICFAGVEMSDAELGFWWLMVQRRRNFVKVQPKQKPPAAILVRDDDPRLLFWRSKPCGIKPLVCATWNEGWEQVRHWGESISRYHEA